MASGRKKFEVRLYANDHWYVEEVFESESAAISCLETLKQENEPEFSGIQVVRTWRRNDGTDSENLIREEKIETKTVTRVRVTPVTDFPPCKKWQDFQTAEARIALAPLLRQYLDKIQLSATELVYGYSQFKKFLDTDLCSPAVECISTIQGKASGENPKHVRDAIYVQLEDLKRALLKIEKNKAVKDFKGKSLEDILKVANAACKDPKELDLYIHVLMGKVLGTNRALEGKLSILVGWLKSEAGADFEEQIDTIIAEIMSSTALMQELLGLQRNLATAIISLVEWLDEGIYDITSGAVPETVDYLCDCFLAERLPQTREVVFDFILRVLGGKQPLASNDHTQEDQEFKNIINKVNTNDGFIGGCKMAQALTERFSKSIKQGGQSGERLAIIWFLDMFETNAMKIVYLLTMCEAPWGEKNPDIINQHIGQIITHAKTVDELLPAGKMSTKEILLKMRGVQVLAHESKISDSQRQSLLFSLDYMVERYITQQKLIDRLDDPNAGLRDRAVRMVQFCKSGILWEHGRALEMVRDRVVSHLRGKSFIEHFTEGEPDPARKEVMVRDFYKLLAEAGFEI